MAFKINDMRTELFDRGYQRQHDYEVQIGIPPGLSGSGLSIGTQPTEIKSITGTHVMPTDVTKMLTLRADTCRGLPGVLMSTQMVQRYGLGPVRKHPINTVFSDTAVTFLVDREGFISSFFYEWMNLISNFGQSVGIGAGTTGGGRLPSYEIEYPYQYLTTITVRQFDPMGSVVEEVSLIDAFPTMVADRPLGWGMVNTISRLIVTFSFQEWTMNRLAASS